VLVGHVLVDAARGNDEDGSGLGHLGSAQVAVAQGAAVDVEDALLPEGRVQQGPQLNVDVGGGEEDRVY